MDFDYMDIKFFKKEWDEEASEEEVDEFENYTEADYLMDQAEAQNQIEKDMEVK